MFDGPSLLAYVSPKTGLDERQKKELLAKVESQLAYNMPRYKVAARLAP